MSKTQKPKSALEIIEEATIILRNNLLKALPAYYIGSFPFVLAFLYFITDMSRSAYAEEHIITASLVLAFLFIWMKCWHAAFCGKILSYIQIQPPSRWSLRQTLRIISSQSITAASGFIFLPLSLITFITFGRVYAFYQNIPVHDNGTLTVKEIIKRSSSSAGKWPGQNYTAIALILLFSIIIFLNISLTIYILPIILKTFLGIESLFTLSSDRVLNTTFLTISLGLTYLTADPLIKTVYTLRCFYAVSIKSGDDIRADIRSLKKRSHAVFCVIVFIIFSAMTADAVAMDKPDNSENIAFRPDASASDRLGSAIDDILKKREFAWRLPIEKTEIINDEPGTIARFGLWIIDGIEHITDRIKGLWKRIRDWFRRPLFKIGQGAENSLFSGNITMGLYFVLAILICILAFIFWKHIRDRKNPGNRVYGQGIPSIPDLTEDYVNPVELSVDRWLNMGYGLMKKQELSLALRAFYLAILALLAEKNMITATRYKTNMDYIKELKRRAHNYSEVTEIFSNSVYVFDRSWYGMHEVNSSILDNFIKNHKRMAELIHG